VKSVSTLWAVADPAVAAVIEQAHQTAIKDALRFIEKHALFTRTGPHGIRQVNVRGLVATAFTHRDSRASDPDLHTHVAVANKVQTLDGRWLSIDGRVLFKANVAASETYNTALEHHLRETLGVRFAERPGTDPAKRPIREIVGVDSGLNQRWSTRRTNINIRRGQLAIQFQKDHGRPPTPVEALHLAQQATFGDPRRQTRTPIADRTTRDLAERSGSSAGRTWRGRIDDADGAYPGRRDAHDR
jgi:conjugative relaxase-like TrwC/TraI family protein